MDKYTFKKINAFSDGTYKGNGAGLIYDNNLTNTNIMQKIATEMEGFVSEVIYVKDGEKDIDFILKYYSCETEVPFCGHGTLAAIYHIVEQTPSLHNKLEIKVKTNRGILLIENRFEKEKTIYIHAPKKEIIESSINLDKLADALNIEKIKINNNIPVVNYNAGQNSLLVCLKSAKDVLNCTPDYQTIREFCFDNNIAVINIFSEDTINKLNDYRVRVFAPTFGYLEDTATGSANSALGYYLKDINIWKKKNLVIEQGLDIDNPNLIYLSTPENDNKKVMFGGKSQLKLEGIYYI